MKLPVELLHAPKFVRIYNPRDVSERSQLARMPGEKRKSKKQNYFQKAKQSRKVQQVGNQLYKGKYSYFNFKTINNCSVNF